MPEFDATVEYRDCPGHPGYKVGNDGTVWSCRKSGPGNMGLQKAWKKLSPGRLRKTGHKYVIVMPVNKTTYVHRLVLEAFVGPCPMGGEACHNDGDPSNNHLSNLRWDSRKNNLADKRKHGTVQVGEKNGLAKLTEDQVRSIRHDYAAGLFTQRQLAQKHGCSQGGIGHIIHRRSWNHVV